MSAIRLLQAERQEEIQHLHKQLMSGGILQRELWEEAMSISGIDGSFYASRHRSEEEVFPWDKIDTGITKEFLLREWHKAQKAETTHDCRYGCVGCGMNRKTNCKFDGIWSNQDKDTNYNSPDIKKEDDEYGI